MVLYASWVHGNSVLLERVGAPSARGKSTVNAAFRGDPGDIIDLGSAASAACLRLGWAARFVIYDSGSENNPKSGSFWCHYAIPTPVIEAGARAEVDKVLINYETNNPRNINLQAVHVWDGNKRIFAVDNLNFINGTTGDDEFDGGISGQTTNANITPNLSRLFVRNIQNRPVFFGLGVSILIRANRAKDDFLEIRGVGIDFQLPR
ncbi:MAG: hypothetical protein F6K58_27200 [Symploca sp. SIO2E9]|nr:hypothetical protein [Symploca sp. SIO2E9]